MDRRILLVLCLLIFTTLTINWLRGGSNSQAATGRAIRIGSQEYKIEVADTVMSQIRGLSGREGLADDHGMLFIFGSPATRSFWMKDMHFPIDIVWINQNKIIGFVENAEPSSGSIMPSTFSSPGPADMVLEISAGQVRKNNFQVGGLIEIVH